MNRWTWKNFVGLAVVAATTWLVLYLVAWSWKYGATQNLGDKFWEGVSSFVLLEWVWDYQTLVAGGLAAAAATTIILNSMYERQKRIEDARAARILDVRDMLSATAMQFQRLGHKIGLDKKADTLEPLMEAIEHQCALLTNEAGPLSNHLMYCLAGVREELENPDETNRGACAALIWAAIYALADNGRYFNTGKFQRTILVLSENQTLKFAPDRLDDRSRERFEQWLQWK